MCPQKMILKLFLIPLKKSTEVKNLNIKSDIKLKSKTEKHKRVIKYFIKTS